MCNMPKRVLILVFAVTILFAFTLSAVEKKAVKKTATVRKPVAVVNFYTGDAKVNQNKKWQKAVLGMQIFDNDIIRIGKKSKLQLKFRNGILSTYSGEKQIKISEVVAKMKTGKKKSVKQLLKSSLNKLSRNSKGKSKLTAVAGVRGDDVTSQKVQVKETEVEWEE